MIEKKMVLQGWLTCNPKSDDSAYCKLCKISLQPRKTNLGKHKLTTKHRAEEEKVNPRIQSKIDGIIDQIISHLAPCFLPIITMNLPIFRFFS